MPFDWNTYKELADRLRQEEDESAKRSAISRLYYSIYHKAKNFLENESDFYFSDNKPAHKQIWDEFIRKGGTYRAIGGNGKRLLSNRNDADYKDDFLRLDEAIETSFKLAENISDYLSQVQSK